MISVRNTCMLCNEKAVVIMKFMPPAELAWCEKVFGKRSVLSCITSCEDHADLLAKGKVGAFKDPPVIIAKL